MKFVHPGSLRLYSFLFSMPLISLAFNLIMYEERLWKDYRVMLFSFPLLFLMGMGSWYMHVLYENKIETRYPDLKQSRQRLFRKSLVLFFVMSPSVLVILLVYNYFNILGYRLQDDDIWKALLLGFCINLVFETLYEADFVFRKYKESKAEEEALSKLAISQEFDALKNQVNPHFLFNCFNTLSSLITVDKNRAEIFLNEMSKVYRYLLRNNEEGVSTVGNEIKFIRSYYQLLQTRHGEAVQLNLNIDPRYNSYLLPSLTLQLLVENVVKHNSLSKNYPLVIDIFTTAANKLVVNNNLQRRTVKAPSNRVGLDNIRAKYELLKQPGFRVMDDDKNFTVVLPLIWKPPEQFNSKPGNDTSCSREDC